MARGSAPLKRSSLAAQYLDTDDRRLAGQGIAWRLRREGRRWVQTLKSGGTNALERFEHEVVRPDATYDAMEHAGTPLGDQLIATLRRSRADGFELSVRFQTEVRRTTRTVRTRGAVVEISMDEGLLVSAGSTVRIREIEFELISGSAIAMLALVERWRQRFGLVYDPRSKAERGDRLAEGSPYPPLRKAGRPTYPVQATTSEAFGAVLDECLSQISRNAIGLAEGDPSLRVEHVHQLRVGIRRLRSALRSFEGWTPAPPVELVASLRALFGSLGMSRDNDVLSSGVVAQLAKFGAPALRLPAGANGPDPIEVITAPDTQRMFLAWIAWRTALTVESRAQNDDSSIAGGPRLSDDGASQVEDSVANRVDAGASPMPRALDDALALRRSAERRLQRWHRRIVADWKSFDQLDMAGLHALRKRIKRQRYAVEFFSPLLRDRKVDRYLNALAAIQERMGELNDLVVARARYQALVAADPAAWFALGWLAARIADVRALAKPELGKLANVDPPTH